MEKQNWVQYFVAIIFLTPVQYFIGGVQYFSAKYWTWVQNVAEYFEPEFNIGVSKYYVTPGM